MKPQGDQEDDRPVWMSALWSATTDNIPGTLPVQTEVEQDVVDSLMASELNSLSLNERVKHVEQLHCIVQDVAEETPEKINSALEAMQRELSMIPDSQKDAYNRAWQLNRQYVEDPKFRLMFLRADRFNPKKAVNRLLLFMEKKRQFFGEDSMVRGLTLNDMTPDDLDGIKAGFMQTLPVRDRAGRLVVIDTHLVGPKRYKTDMVALRVYFYHILTALEDEDSQKYGLVNVMYYLGTLRMKENRDPAYATELALSDRWLPYRSTGIHMCCFRSNKTLQLVFRALSILTVPEKRVVIRIHEGTHTEVQYLLMTFGIPIDVIPVSSDGELKTATNKKWIVARHKKEQNILLYGHNFGRIDFPRNKDVLLGKGRPLQKHAGNVSLRTLVSSLTESYFRADSKSTKASLTWKVVSDIKSSGGRFLCKDRDDFWVEASDKEARDKVGKLFMTSQAQYKATGVSVPTRQKLHAEEADRMGLLDVRVSKRPKICIHVCGS